MLGACRLILDGGSTLGQDLQNIYWIPRHFLSAYLPWGHRTVFLGRLRLRVIGSIRNFWKLQSTEVRKKPRFKKHLMLDMYLGAFGRGVMVVELEDLNAALKIFNRQLIIRRVCFTTEVPDKVGLYIGKLKAITESMRRRLNSGETIGAVAKSVRDFQIATNAYRDNEVQTFNIAWQNWEAQIFKVSVAATNGHTYPKFIPPNEDECWTCFVLVHYGRRRG
jgi:hypothetical protein